MKKLLFLLLLMFLFSCQKEKNPCWTCTEAWKGYTNGNKTWEVCDVLEASHQDGRRWIVTTVISPPPNGVTAVTVHTVSCSQE